MQNQDIELVIKLIGVIGVLIASGKAIYEIQQNRKQRKIEFRWKQTKEAKSLIGELLTENASKYATYMIDWTGREYQVSETDKESITWEEVREALRTVNTSFNDKEVFIRDCFDAFLFYMEIMEQSICNNLFEFRDIDFPMKYYVDTIVKNQLKDSISNYVSVYQFQGSKKFFDRFSSWKS